jgi:hypothetical protein
LNGGALLQHLEPTLPKPGVRGSSPLLDANKINDLMTIKADVMERKSHQGMQ